MKLGKDGVKRLVLLTSSSDLIPVWNGWFALVVLWSQRFDMVTNLVERRVGICWRFRDVDISCTASIYRDIVGLALATCRAGQLAADEWMELCNLDFNGVPSSWTRPSDVDTCVPVYLAILPLLCLSSTHLPINWTNRQARKYRITSYHVRAERTWEISGQKCNSFSFSFSNCSINLIFIHSLTWSLAHTLAKGQKCREPGNWLLPVSYQMRNCKCKCRKRFHKKVKKWRSEGRIKEKKRKLISN